ncbi:MAG TPA: biotin carboxylase N-terminal domain-containing protein [Nocardioides sp.]|uniref:acetyl/propionyl/methylcrotonyl-CoA carboxylase subunit alpha n=1 Tax=Nocardioides sp. TaxID=35761 RepID=UPI002ED94DFA
MIKRVLVANRAEIASRVFRTCRRLGISTVAVFSDADEALPYVGDADFAVRLPGNTPGETYLRGDLVIEAARRAGADAVHPGYGFLSESADFARAVIDAGLTWIGPSPESIEAMGSKIGAKAIMKAAGVPVLEAPEAPTEADLPLLVKASAGGGGRGMRIVRSLADLEREIATARAEAESAFGDGTVFVEPYVERGRHVEVQLVGTMVFGDRDCSIPRRHQKVVEEAPAPGLPDHVRTALHEAARNAAEAIDYRGAGTVEFLYDEATERFWFLEMNTRLQVEHPVTEEVFGVDLVELQLQAANGDWIMGWTDDPVGHSIEVRLYAEDPEADYQPQSGRLSRFEISAPTGPTGGSSGIRVEAGYRSGSTVSTFYDAMLAKVIATAPTRREAAGLLAATLRRARIHGVRTNRDLLVSVLESPAFLGEQVSTAFLAEHAAGRTGQVEGAGQDLEKDTGAPVAATIALTERAAARRTVQQRIPVGWRNVTSRPQRTEFEDGTVVEWLGTRRGYAVDGFTVVSTRPARSSQACSTSEWVVVLERDGVRTTYDVAVDGEPGRERVDVDSPYGHTALLRTPRFVDPTTQVAAGSLLAPMPGSVIAVHAAVGETVTEGQPILVMEAMKMQHTIAAPYAGTVTELAASVGQQVEAGTVLAVVDDATQSESTEEQG